LSKIRGESTSEDDAEKPDDSHPKTNAGNCFQFQCLQERNQSFALRARENCSQQGIRTNASLDTSLNSEIQSLNSETQSDDTNTDDERIKRNSLIIISNQQPKSKLTSNNINQTELNLPTNISKKENNIKN
jgi:hypothetical protein